MTYGLVLFLWSDILNFFKGTLTLKCLYFYLVHRCSLYFFTVSAETALFGGLHAAVLLCLCPEVGTFLLCIGLYAALICNCHYCF